jgi:hypothetical protein
MGSLICAVLAFICFVLVVLGLSVAVNLTALGLAFLALAVALGHWPAVAAYRRQ